MTDKMKWRDAKALRDRIEAFHRVDGEVKMIIGLNGYAAADLDTVEQVVWRADDGRLYCFQVELVKHVCENMTEAQFTEWMEKSK